MCNGVPLFPGSSEKDQLNKIFKQLGAPDEEAYPGICDLPDWPSVRKNLQQSGAAATQTPEDLNHLVQNKLPKEGMDLLTRMLQYDPSKRIRAKVSGSIKAFQHKRSSDPLFSFVIAGGLAARVLQGPVDQGLA